MTSVSAVIPVHNGADYVAAAIRSALEQTAPPLGCLVVDDGSTDATPGVVRAFGSDVEYVRQPRAGVSVARNRGAALANTELVAFLDHDDTWLPTKLERQLEALAMQPEAPLVVCAMEVVDAAGSTLGSKHLRPRTDLITGMMTFDGTETVSCSSTGMVRRDWLLGAGGFDPQLGMSADWDLLLRAALDGSVGYIDEPLVRYRVHGSNMSSNIGTMERDMRRAFGKAFADSRLPANLRATRRRAYGGLYRMLAGSYRDTGDRVAMTRAALMAVGHDPALALEPFTRLRRRATAS